MNSVAILTSVARVTLRAVTLSAAMATAQAAPLPPSDPADLGLDPARLERITETFDAKVEHGDFPGAVVLIARHGRVAYRHAFGRLRPDAETPMPVDAIFRLYSMSKPITSVALMTLVEDGRIDLDHPVANHLPPLAHLRVAAVDSTRPPSADEPIVTVALKRPITLQDLLRHTSGITYGFPFRSPVQRRYAEANLWDEQRDCTTFVDRIAELPLAEQPGTIWDYGHSTDLVGCVIEAVSGRSLLEVERDRILAPLAMEDTGFDVTDPKSQDRLAEGYSDDRHFGHAGGRVDFDDPRVPKRWQSGGAGMVSTADDYARFLQMLLDRGHLDGHRVLAPKTVDFLTADHLGTTIAAPFPGYGWSLAFAVRRDAGISTMPGTVGDYFWFNASGGSFWVDPKEDLLAVFLAYQPKQMESNHALLRQLVYSAL